MESQMSREESELRIRRYKPVSGAPERPQVAKVYILEIEQRSLLVSQRVV